jgi:dienelactone hydrolase
MLYPGAYHDFDYPDLPLRQRTNVASTRSGRATLGTDPAARADALLRVPAFLARVLPP